MSKITDKTQKKQTIICKTPKRYIKEAAICSLLAALMCVSGMISIPLFIPATLQTLVLFFGLFYIGGRLTSLSVLLYILIGVIGVPVFSGFSGGASRLFDQTGGFIFGLLLSSLLYWLLEYILPRLPSAKLISGIVSHILLYLVGALWFALGYLGGSEHIPFALLTSVLPFLIPDAIKFAAAYIIAKRIPKLT